jgi:hypothetical protein
MGRTVFFSWQSDRSTQKGRNLIESALESAVSRIAEDTEVDPAVRDLAVDKDTKGVSGSPPIFDTILKKIKEAAVFVPDLTFVGNRVDGDPTPNPNVLIEYGWALKCLGHHRIVAVMNEAYGKPASLPFDLAHHRFPITYNVPDDASDSLRREQRKKLSETLEAALRAVFESPENRESLPKEPEQQSFKQKEPMLGNARFRARREPLGVSVDIVSQMVGSPVTNPVVLVDGAAEWLRLMPVTDPGRTWLVQELKERAMKLSILPLIPSGGDVGFVRSNDGCGYYRTTGGETAYAVSYVFTTGEVWIINALVGRAGLYFELNENGYSKSIEGCASFLESLGIKEPYRWMVGIEGIKDDQLRIPNRYDRVWGPCLTDMVKREGLYRTGDDTAKLLDPFFNEVFDQCGLERRLLSQPK